LVRKSNGQGHETVYARFLSDETKTGIPADRNCLSFKGDSDRIANGRGTAGHALSRCRIPRRWRRWSNEITSFTAYLSEKEDGAVSFDDERFRIAGMNLTPTNAGTLRNGPGWPHRPAAPRQRINTG